MVSLVSWGISFLTERSPLKGELGSMLRQNGEKSLFL